VFLTVILLALAFAAASALAACRLEFRSAGRSPLAGDFAAGSPGNAASHRARARSYHKFVAALRRFFSAAASSSARPDRLLTGSDYRGPDPNPGMTPPLAPRRSRTRASLGAVLGVGLLLPAVGAAESASRAFDLPAGDAAVTLKAFAAQSGEQLLYSPDDLQAVRTAAVRGDLAPLAALELMLSGTRLRARRDDGARAIAITLRPAVPAPPASPPLADSDPMKKRSLLTVLAAALAFGPAGASAQTAPLPAADDATIVLREFVVNPEEDTTFLSKRTTAGTKTNEAIRDTPAAITVLSREFLDALTPATINDALRYAPGVNTNRPAVFGAQVEMRGFLVNAVLIDGHTEDVNQIGDFAHIERVEVLNGPASLLFGNVGTVGGTVNRVTKKPSFKTRREVSADLGAHDEHRLTADLTGPVANSQTFAYRLIASWRETDFDSDFAHYEHTHLRGALSWRPSDKLFSTVSLGWFTYDFVTNARYAWYDFRNNSILTPATGANLVEDKRVFQIRQWQALWDTYLRLSPSVVVRNSLYAQLHRRPFFGGYNFVARLNNDRRSVNRGDNYQDSTVGILSEVLDATIDYAALGARNKLILSAQASVGVNDQYSKFFAAPPAFDLLAPVYGRGAPRSLATRLHAQTRDQHDRTDTLAFSAVHVARFWADRLALTAGARFDKVKQETRSTFNRATQRIVPVTFNLPWNTTPRLGLVFAATRELNLYYAYSESFIPQLARQPDSSYFDPQLGRQHELGAKADLFAGKLALNVALFDLNLRNVYVNDPDPVRAALGYRIKGSETTTEGAEFSFQAAPARGWQAFGSFTYLDSINARDVLNPAAVGRRAQRVPRVQASFFGRYEIASGPLAGFSLGGGWKYRGGTAEPNTFAQALTARTRTSDEAPSYAVADLIAGYRAGKRWSAQLNVTNLFDRTYYFLWNNDRLDLGDARAVKLSARYEF
jgi:iron complex outermembrane receptor protein